MLFSPRRSIVATIATCVAVAVAAPPAGAAGGTAADAAGLRGTTLTPFAMTASAYGSRVQGGQVPADSGRTAFSYIGCTKLAGKSAANQLVEGNLGGEGVVQGVDTRSWTSLADGAVNSFAKTDIAYAKIGGLVLRNIALTTRAWHDSTGFHASRTAKIGSLRLDGGLLDLPTFPGQEIDVPGVGTLVFLTGFKSVTGDGARITATAVRLKLDDNRTVITLGSAFSEINNENPAGIFGGYGQAAEVTALDGTLKSGRVALQPLPCRGTDGRWINNDTAALTLNSVAELGAVSGGANADQANERNGYGSTRGRVSSLNLLGGEVVARVIQGQANVRMVDGAIERSIRGTSVGFLSIDGEEVLNPRPGDSFPIEGAGTLDIGRVTVGKRVEAGTNAVHVIALQVHLFNGGEADTLVNLGEALVRYTRS